MPSRKVYKSNGNSKDRTPPKYRHDDTATGSMTKHKEARSNCIYCPPKFEGGMPEEAIKAWHDNGHPRSTPAFADIEGALITPPKQATPPKTKSAPIETDFRPQEVIDRIEYKYKQMDGTIDFPNSYEGDVLRIAYKTAKATPSLIHKEVLKAQKATLKDAKKEVNYRINNDLQVVEIYRNIGGNVVRVEEKVLDDALKALQTKETN
ncbi:hypothetical protein UFOVP585_4 [uncultured Caudovirales phage]|uniref:Uncharacterized protein n=1 Tax=uncultured Caudovirales phage TaxID=2100421 RepID=A0A6J5N1S7_9CAUD|nr:hypothetical protein UFOVP585_4 [uncultured Caudovirales phage]